MPKYNTEDFGVTNHVVTRYRQRVEDDPKRDNLTHKEISRKIKISLREAGNRDSRELSGSGYAIPVRFKTNKGRTRNYYCVLRPTYTQDRWSVVSLLTEEMVDSDIRDLI